MQNFLDQKNRAKFILPPSHFDRKALTFPQTLPFSEYESWIIIPTASLNVSAIKVSVNPHTLNHSVSPIESFCITTNVLFSVLYGDNEHVKIC